MMDYSGTFFYQNTICFILFLFLIGMSLWSLYLHMLLKHTTTMLGILLNQLAIMGIGVDMDGLYDEAQKVLTKGADGAEANQQKP